MAVTLAEVLAHSIALKNAIVAGEPVNAWEHTLPLQQFAIDGARSQGFKSTAADATTCKEIYDCLTECEALCQTPPVSTTPAVGKIGDGKIIDAILKLVTTLLPLFL